MGSKVEGCAKSVDDTIIQAKMSGHVLILADDSTNWQLYTRSILFVEFHIPISVILNRTYQNPIHYI